MTSPDTIYRRRLAYDRINGIERRVDATQTRAHLERLTARGWTYKQIAAATGLDASTFGVIRSGRYHKVARATATAILAVRLDQAPPIPRGLTDATGTRRRLQALMVLGYPLPDVARQVGVSYFSLIQTAGGNGSTVRTPTAEKVARVYRRLSLAPAPPTRTAELVRNEAMAQGWVGPGAWDDIDDPACEPEPCEVAGPRHLHPDDVAELAGRGLDDREIGRRLGVSDRTVLRARVAHNIPVGVAA
jgi:transcriptional regulator with XRE-family HTH domain